MPVESRVQSQERQHTAVRFRRIGVQSRSGIWGPKGAGRLVSQCQVRNSVSLTLLRGDRGELRVPKRWSGWWVHYVILSPGQCPLWPQAKSHWTSNCAAPLPESTQNTSSCRPNTEVRVLLTNPATSDKRTRRQRSKQQTQLPQVRSSGARIRHARPIRDSPALRHHDCRTYAPTPSLEPGTRPILTQLLTRCSASLVLVLLLSSRTRTGGETPDTLLISGIRYARLITLV